MENSSVFSKSPHAGEGLRRAVAVNVCDDGPGEVLESAMSHHAFHSPVCFKDMTL